MSNVLSPPQKLNCLQGGSEMLIHRAASILILICLASIATAQGNGEAWSRYNSGREHLQKGDLDKAIVDFTRAIEVSSRAPGSDRRVRRDLRAGFNSSVVADESESD